MSRPLPNQSTDGVGRANGPAPTAEFPAPAQHPADAASVLTPELLDRETGAEVAGSIVVQIFAALRLARRQRRTTVIDVDSVRCPSPESVACALLPLAALPPVWQVGLVGFGLSMFAGVGLILIFLPAGRRSVNAQVPLRSVSQHAAGLDAEPASGDFYCDPYSSWTASQLDRTTGGFDVETPVVRVFQSGEVQP